MAIEHLVNFFQDHHTLAGFNLMKLLDAKILTQEELKLAIEGLSGTGYRFIADEIVEFLERGLITKEIARNLIWLGR